VGVVSRSQKDLDNKKSVHDAVEDEKVLIVMRKSIMLILRKGIL